MGDGDEPHEVDRGIGGNVRDMLSAISVSKAAMQNIRTRHGANYILAVTRPSSWVFLMHIILQRLVSLALLVRHRALPIYRAERNLLYLHICDRRRLDRDGHNDGSWRRGIQWYAIEVR
jgi:hypothetical protein